MASIIIDDTSSSFSYGGGTWRSVTSSHFYGGGAIYPNFSRGPNGDSGVYGSLTFSFQGTSIAFFGNTPPAQDSQWSMYSIDGGAAYNSSFMDPSPPSFRQWYQSPTLSDAQHDITITQIPSTSVDYVVVTAGENTPLLDQTLIVDDSDPSITYQGSWTQNTSPLTTSYSPPVGLPFGNATHQTNSAGDSAAFGFTGTGVTVAGVFSFDMIGSLSVNYTLDGFSSIQTYTSQANIHGQKQTPNFTLFKNNSLTSGNHTLLMQIISCVNQVFELDYILYSPSFSTLASKPSLPTISLTRSSSHFSTSTSTAAAQHTSAKSSTHAATIVGSVGGGVGFLLLILIFLFRNRLFKRAHPSPYTRTSGTPGPLPLNPFILPASTPRETTGLHSPETKFEMKTPAIQTSFLSSSSQPASATLSPSTPSSSALGDERVSSQRHRLQTLFEELHRENTAASGASGNSLRVVELHGRIAELVRLENENSGGRVIHVDEVEQVPPPAYYEPD